MFERFTERARQVVVGAQEEARTLRHAHLGTEHILLAVLREEEGLAARVLESLGITIERARAEVVRIVGFGQEVTVGQIPFTEDGKRVLELSIHEALGLGHDYIGPEHILLGLVRDNKGVPARILLDSDAGAGPKIRNELMRLLSAGEAQRSAGAKPVGGRRPRHSIDKAWFDGLGGVLNGLAREIRSELDREPDTGDLVLELACSPTLAAQALRELGVNAEELSGLIERVRTHRPPSAEAELARKPRGRAPGQGAGDRVARVPAADQMRDQERELTQQARADATVTPEVIQEICRHLGIPTQTNAPPK